MFQWRKVPRWPAWPAWVVVVVALWVLLVATDLYLAHRLQHPITLCLFKRVTGVPCPTCGCTRALISAAHGEWARAVACNPLAVIVGTPIAALLVVRLISGWTLVVQPGRWMMRAALIAGCCALAANWAYLIWRGM